MAKEPESKAPERQNFWQTTAGTITGITALITAITGLLAALTQAGLLGNRDARTLTNDDRVPVIETTRPPAALPTLAVAISPTAANAAPPPAPTSGPAVSSASAVAPGPVTTAATVYLPSGDTVTVDDAVVKILAARVENQAGAASNLHLVVRVTSLGENWITFAPSTFRLLVDGVPRAPTKSFDQYVAPRSALEGEVVFAIPKTVNSLVLQIYNRSATVELPLSLTAGSGGAAPNTPNVGRAPTSGSLAVSLPSGDSVTVEDAVYKILSMGVENQTGDRANVQFNLRVTSQGENWVSFAPGSFRLLVDGVPRAPTKSTDQFVAPRSALEGDVVFAIPKTATSLALQIHGRKDTVEIPLSLTTK